MTESATHAYLRLKLARELYGKAPGALDAAEARRVATVARKQAEIETRILSTDEASRVCLPASSVDQAIAQIRARYESEPDFQTDLQRHELTAENLRAAIQRDLSVEAVLEQVAARARPVSDTEVEIFYLQHASRFHKPETRTLRHILITINDALPGNEREQARKKIDGIHARLVKEPARHAEQAMKHSECPTALSGGLLGDLPRGRLYPELDAIAFALSVGQLSEVVESPLGFHLLYCEAIDAARPLTLAEARVSILGHLAETRRQMLQKTWVKSLFA